MVDENQDILDTLAKAAGITAIGMFVSKFLSYAYRAIIARLVGPEAYGNISIGLMIVSLGITISTLSLGSAIYNYLPKYRENNQDDYIRGLISSTFYMSIPTALFFAGSVFLSADFLASEIFKNNSLATIIRIFSIAIPFSVVTSHSLDTTEAFKTAKYAVLVRKIGQNVIQVLASLILILGGLELLGAAYGWLIGAVLGSIASLYIMEKKFGPFLTSRKPKKTQYRKIFRYSYPLILAGAIGSVLGWTDTFFIGYYMPETQVGLYNAALPTAMLMMIPLQALSSLVLPSMSETVGKEDGDLDSLLKTLTRWTFTISFPMFCLMALFSDQVLHILFGAEYTQAATSLTILAFGFLYSTSVGHLDSVIKAIEKTKVIHKNAAINFFVNIGLNILLIPPLGIVGAAVATTGSIIFSQTLLLIEVYYFEKTTPFTAETLKPMLSASISLLSTYLLIEYWFKTVPMWALIPGGLVFGLIYLLALHFTGGIKESERAQIKRILNSIKRSLKSLR